MQAFAEPGRSIPIEAEYDVCVLGGGVAGAAAALAAAREGARTCLIEKEYALGGLATLGLIVIYLPLCDGNGRQVIAGISEEFLRASLKYGPGDLPDCWNNGGDAAERRQKRYQTRYEAASLTLALEELLLSAGVTLWYDTRLCAAACEGGKVQGVIVENKSGRLGIRAKAFVDATGDADLCYMAGKPRFRSPPTCAQAGIFPAAARACGSTNSPIPMGQIPRRPAAMRATSTGTSPNTRSTGAK